MNFKHIVRTAAAAALVAASASASAGYVVLDGWQLTTPSTSKSQIGRLNLASGDAQVQQEVNGLGQAFVGARFTETGTIYSVTYTKENTVGAGDTGSPKSLGDDLIISFSNVAGKVTSLNPGGGFHYTFTSGMFSIGQDGGPTYASGSIIGLGGNASSTTVIGGVNGDSTLLAMVLNILNPGFSIKDSLGNSLASDMASGKVLFQTVTNNFISSTTGPAKCSFDASATCITATATSGGDAYLVRDIPEPASIALAGVALLGLGVARRRSAKK
ncbi:PEP-CTERM sorting domain-containing protein [Pelomonas sp. BJYL3]|uniref:PEP-CTERM sorting domain-containing protein n=1 Tax=Pelomonas sp. BJYL3 TaxID=2976697 RepID=UPI0022B33ECC|nr:PEP-CTERM sorting domain-containing protein [Pelomonas sp. BJYL3]